MKHIAGAAHQNGSSTKTGKSHVYHRLLLFPRKPDDLIKISVVFEGRLIGGAFESDTEASVGRCDGAACIAWISRPVENRKFL
jgi:hypothetical protein